MEVIGPENMMQVGAYKDVTTKYVKWGKWAERVSGEEELEKWGERQINIRLVK